MGEKENVRLTFPRFTAARRLAVRQTLGDWETFCGRLTCASGPPRETMPRVSPEPLGSRRAVRGGALLSPRLQYLPPPLSHISPHPLTSSSVCRRPLSCAAYVTTGERQSAMERRRCGPKRPMGGDPSHGGSSSTLGSSSRSCDAGRLFRSSLFTSNSTSFSIKREPANWMKTGVK